MSASARPGWARWVPRRLSSRILLVFLGVLLLVQLAGFAVVRWSIDDNAHELLAKDLERGGRIWERLLAQRAQQLTLAAGVLAADIGFRAALASGDLATLSSALDNHGARIGATVSAMLAPDLTPRAIGEGTERVALAALRPLAERLAQQRTALALMGDRPYQFVMVPIKAPQLIGYVVMGFGLDAALLKDMREVSGLQVAIAVRPAGGAERLMLSTLGDAAGAELLAGTTAGDSVDLQGSAYMVRAITALGGTPAAGAVRTLLLRAVDEAVAPYKPLQRTLAAITLAGLLLAAASSVVITRRVTTPLHSLVDASERLGRGDYEQALSDTVRRDEIGDLARSFDLMRSRIVTREAEIRRLAYWDRLTGLPNRVMFGDAVRQAIEAAGRSRQPVAVLLLDIDRFKHVNEVLGYGFGDRMLEAVAERLAVQVRGAGEMVARQSGDEFALLLPNRTAAEAVALAARIADAFHTPLQMDDHTVDLSASFGIACWPQHAADAQTLITRAEVAMYAAKTRHSTTMVYDPASDIGSARTLSLLSELRHALDNDELRLFLQPKIALVGPNAGRMTGAESLVRWQHPQRGMVPPLDFIPFAEQTGFVRQLTLWIFEATARAWPMLAGLGLERVSINLSTRDLMDQDLPAKLDRVLQRLGVPARVFCLEIIESAIMDDPDRAMATLNALSQAGFKLSIDDFGTGYSSLAYLQRLPVDELKIDKSFVMAMERNEGDAMIVRSTIDLAHNLGLSVVAEGVENAAILGQLQALDCDEAQGYHMGRPMPAAEMTAFAARWSARVQGGAGLTVH